MSDTIKLLVDDYEEYVNGLESAAEQLVIGKPAEDIYGDTPGWIKYVFGCNNMLYVTEQYTDMISKNA